MNNNNKTNKSLLQQLVHHFELNKNRKNLIKLMKSRILNYISNTDHSIKKLTHRLTSKSHLILHIQQNFMKWKNRV